MTTLDETPDWRAVLHMKLGTALLRWSTTLERWARSILQERQP